MKKFLFNKWTSIVLNLSLAILTLASLNTPYSTIAVLGYGIFVILYNDQKDKYNTSEKG